MFFKRIVIFDILVIGNLGIMGWLWNKCRILQKQLDTERINVVKKDESKTDSCK